ncbi:unnamed protein product, partial [Musa hybrid cultivar]
SRIPCSPPGPDLKEASHDIITAGISVSIVLLRIANPRLKGWPAQRMRSM